MSDLNRRIRIYIDGSNVSSASAKIKQEIASIEQQIGSLDKTSENYNRELSKLKSSLERNHKTLNSYNKGMEETERVLRNVSGASYNELIAVRKNLVQEMRQAIPGTEKYNRALEHHRAVSRQVVLPLCWITSRR